MRRKSRDSLMKEANVTGKLSIGGGKVLQRWRGSGGNSNLRVTFDYLIYC